MKKNLTLFFSAITKNIGLGIAFSLVIVFCNNQVKAQTPWYFNGAGALNDLASWGTNPNGTGGTLTSFTTGGRYFIIQNTTAVSLTGIWNVGNTLFASAGGDSIIIGNHTTAVAPITLTLTPGSALTVNKSATIAVAVPSSGNNKIIYQNSTVLSFGAIADVALEIVFDASTITMSSTNTFGDISLINNSSVNMGGAALILRNLNVAVGSTLTGPIGSSSNFIGVKTGGIVTINGIFKAGRQGGFTTPSVTFPIVPVNTNGSLLFQDAITQGSNLILSSTSTIDFNRALTSGQAGTQTITALSYANLTLSSAASFVSNKVFASGTTTISGLMTINMFSTSSITALVAQNIIFNPLSRLTILSATTLQIGTGTLTLKSDATGTAMIGTIASGASITGNVVIERYLPAKRAWRMLTAPVTLASPTTLSATWKTLVDIVGPSGTGLSSTKPAYNFITYNIATDDWTGVSNPNTETLMGSGASASNKAFGTFIPGPNGTADNTQAVATLSSTGRLQTGQQTFNITAGLDKYAMIGNPYASPVDLNAVYGASTNIYRTFYTWDPQLAGTGGYITISWDGVSAYDILGGATAQTTILQSGQAFFVRASAANPTVVFQEAHKSTTNINNVFGVGNNTIDRLTINLEKVVGTQMESISGVLATYGSMYYKAVNFHEDVEKLWNNEENISIKRDAYHLSIERRPYATQADTIFLNISSARVNTNYNLNFTPSNWDAGSNAYLIDKVLNTETLISLNGTFNHQFTSQVANVGDRFMVVFRGGTLPNRGFTVGAEKVGTNAVKVNWEVQAETGVKNYELQKSADGVSFVTVNTQDGKNGNLTNVYNYTDNSPVIGMNYYRVKTTQLNDIEHYSNIVTINFKNQSSNQVNVFPNPVKGNILTLQLNDLEKGIVKTRLMDMTGKQLEVQQFTYNGGSAAQTITLNKVYASGTYQLQVEVKNFKKVITVIIANN